MNTIRQELAVVSLTQGQLLADSHEQVKSAYFPQSGILSFVVELLDGEAIETAMVDATAYSEPRKRSTTKCR